MFVSNQGTCVSPVNECSKKGCRRSFCTLLLTSGLHVFEDEYPKSKGIWVELALETSIRCVPFMDFYQQWCHRDPKT